MSACIRKGARACRHRAEAQLRVSSCSQCDGLSRTKCMAQGQHTCWTVCTQTGVRLNRVIRMLCQVSFMWLMATAGIDRSELIKDKAIT
jgi:hypothetical protein